ncbi:TPA: hypothetical protein DCX16_05560 [bacterium]|nr:hypothetical protein [bacterium]
MKKILVADDDLNIRTALSEALSEEGYEVIAVGTGGEALKIALEKKLDLLILDIKMPDIHGIDVLKRLRAKGKTLPVIILTAFPAMEKDMEIQLGKISAFISKPFDLEEVKNTVRGIVVEETENE